VVWIGRGAEKGGILLSVYHQLLAENHACTHVRQCDQTVSQLITGTEHSELRILVALSESDESDSAERCSGQTQGCIISIRSRQRRSIKIIQSVMPLAAQPSFAQSFNPMQRALIIPQANQQRTTTHTSTLSNRTSLHARFTAVAAEDELAAFVPDGYRKALVGAQWLMRC
jgi:hypothetical protein